MSDNNIKQAVLELAQGLPDDCTWDDVMYEVHIRQKIAAGLRAVEEGRTIPHEQVFAEFGWAERTAGTVRWTGNAEELERIAIDPEFDPQESE